MAGEIRNIKHEVRDDGVLVIEIDLNKDFGPTTSGKNTLVASSGGFNPTMVEGMTFNITATKKLP